MTIAELIELLQQLPGDMPVMSLKENWEDSVWQEVTQDNVQIVGHKHEDSGRSATLYIGTQFESLEFAYGSAREYLKASEENAHILKHFYGESTENESS